MWSYPFHNCSFKANSAGSIAPIPPCFPLPLLCLVQFPLVTNSSCTPKFLAVEPILIHRPCLYRVNVAKSKEKSDKRTNIHGALLYLYWDVVVVGKVQL